MTLKILGGGGGVCMYTIGGVGGNAGGGGACGYYSGANSMYDKNGANSTGSYMAYGSGGAGLVILQYATK